MTTEPHDAPDGAPAPDKNKSTKQISDENHARLRLWLDAADKIPCRPDGTVNVSVIFELAGVDRQIYYAKRKGPSGEKMPSRAQEMIEVTATAKGLGLPNQERAAPGGDSVPAWAKQRIKELEESVAVARAEAHDLRLRLTRLEHIERHVATTGMYPR